MPNSTLYRTRARASWLINRRAARAGKRGRYTATQSPHFVRVRLMLICCPHESQRSFAAAS